MSDFAGVVLMFVSVTTFMIFVLMLLRHESSNKKDEWSYQKGYRDAIEELKQHPNNPNEQN